MATTKTELYNNGTLVATKTSAPFNTFDWTPASGEVGSASLTVKRYEEGVLVATSAAVGGTVDAAGTTYDSDYQAKLDYATANSIPLPSTAQSDIYNQRLVDFKANGGWEKSNVVADLSGTADIRFKLLCIKRLVEMTVTGGVTSTATGVAGNGTTGFVNTLFAPGSVGSLYTLNNGGVFYIANTNPEGAKATLGAVGASGGTGRGIVIIGNRASGDSYYNMGAQDGSANTKTPLDLQKIGANGMYRYNATSIDFMTDVTNNITQASDSVVPDNNIYLFADNNKGVARSFSNIELGFIAIGASMATEHNALKTALTT
jgi:hypothetical protein